MSNAAKNRISRLAATDCRLGISAEYTENGFGELCFRSGGHVPAELADEARVYVSAYRAKLRAVLA